MIRSIFLYLDRTFAVTSPSLLSIWYVRHTPSLLSIWYVRHAPSLLSIWYVRHTPSLLSIWYVRHAPSLLSIWYVRHAPPLYLWYTIEMYETLPQNNCRMHEYYSQLAVGKTFQMLNLLLVASGYPYFSEWVYGRLLWPNV